MRSDTKTMRAIVCAEPQDDLSTTALKAIPLPLPEVGEVRVKVAAVSINPVDWKLCTGVAPWWHEPHVVGLDAAGVIDALGKGVKGWQIGERVVWHGNLESQGVFAEFATAPSHVISRIPVGISDSAAAAIPCAGYTAYQGLVRKAHIKAGDVIVVQGATGGAGGFAIQIAKAKGARVIALVRQEEFDWAKNLGADEVLDYNWIDLPARVRGVNYDEGADIMFEVVNPNDARRSLDLIRYNGQLITIDPLPNMSKTPAYTYAASIHEVALGGAYSAEHFQTQCDLAKMGDELLSLMDNGLLDPMITEMLSLEEIPDGLKRLRARQVKGKLVAVL